jgi:hypothetical protein
MNSRQRAAQVAEQPAHLKRKQHTYATLAAAVAVPAATNYHMFRLKVAATSRSILSG